MVRRHQECLTKAVALGLYFNPGLSTRARDSVLRISILTTFASPFGQFTASPVMANAVQPDKGLLSTPRSCHRCNQKKVRCSKTQPCDSCLKSNSDCVFPGPSRAPRRKKRPLKAELISRLKGLEQELREMTQERGDPDSAASSAATSQDAPVLSNTPLAANNARHVEHEHGKLIVEGDSTRYVTHEVLISLGNQVCITLNYFLGCGYLANESLCDRSKSSKTWWIRLRMMLMKTSVESIRRMVINSSSATRPLHLRCRPFIPA